MDYKGYTIYPDGQIRGKGKKMLKHYINQYGYHTVCICTKGVSEYMKVHRLVAICYLSNPQNKQTVHHIDEDKDNNDLTNLMWATNQENNKYKTKMMSTNTSGIIGVSYNKRINRWIAILQSYGKRYTKTFKTKDEAIIYRKYLEETYKNN